MVDGQEIQFRPLTLSDLELIHRWLNNDFVARWWPGWPSLQQVRAKYLARIEGRDPTKCFVMMLDGVPQGLVQRYRVRDDPNLSALIEQPERAAGIDLFLGDRAYAYQGLGPRIIRRFLADAVFAQSDTDRCLIDPAQNNAAAIRAYQKAGFKHLCTIKVPAELQPSYVMILRRGEFSDA